MKITLEVDENIIKGNPPEMAIITIEREAVTLDEVLSMLEDLLLGAGYRFKGNLTIKEEVDNDNL